MLVFRVIAAIKSVPVDREDCEGLQRKTTEARVGVREQFTVGRPEGKKNSKRRLQGKKGKAQVQGKTRELETVGFSKVSEHRGKIQQVSRAWRLKTERGSREPGTTKTSRTARLRRGPLTRIISHRCVQSSPSAGPWGGDEVKSHPGPPKRERETTKTNPASCH